MKYIIYINSGIFLCLVVGLIALKHSLDVEKNTISMCLSAELLKVSQLSETGTASNDARLTEVENCKKTICKDYSNLYRQVELVRRVECFKFAMMIILNASSFVVWWVYSKGAGAHKT